MLAKRQITNTAMQKNQEEIEISYELNEVKISSQHLDHTLLQLEN